MQRLVETHPGPLRGQLGQRRGQRPRTILIAIRVGGVTQEGKSGVVVTSAAGDESEVGPCLTERPADPRGETVVDDLVREVLGAVEVSGIEGALPKPQATQAHADGVAHPGEELERLLEAQIRVQLPIGACGILGQQGSPYPEQRQRLAGLEALGSEYH